jgi:hypothetical protein
MKQLSFRKSYVFKYAVYDESKRKTNHIPNFIFKINEQNFINKIVSKTNEGREQRGNSHTKDNNEVKDITNYTIHEIDQMCIVHDFNT